MRLLTNPSGAQGPRNAASCREKVQRDSSRCLLGFCPPFSVDNIVHLWLGGRGPRGTAEELGAAPEPRPPAPPPAATPSQPQPGGGGRAGAAEPGRAHGRAGAVLPSGTRSWLCPGECCRGGSGGLSPAAVNLSWFLRGAAGQR